MKKDSEKLLITNRKMVMSMLALVAASESSHLAYSEHHSHTEYGTLGNMEQLSYAISAGTAMFFLPNRGFKAEDGRPASGMIGRGKIPKRKSTVLNSGMS